MTPALQANVREGHPEVTFAKLKGSFVATAKKTLEGLEERMALLATQGLAFDLDAERQKLRRMLVSRDDMIDAVAMLATARGVQAGDAVVLGDGRLDSRGLLMQMWA